MIDIVDESECTEDNDNDNDIVERSIWKAKAKFESLEKDDFSTVTIYKPPEPYIFTNILMEIKKEFSGDDINKRCTEFILAELGHNTFYNMLKSSGFLIVQKIVKKIRDAIGSRLIDGYPEMSNFVISQRDNTVRTDIHVSQQQHVLLKQLAHDLYIPIGDVLLICIICSFNVLRDRFKVCQNTDIKYDKYCSMNGYMSVIADNIREIVKKAYLYVINSKKELELSIEERLGAINSRKDIGDGYKNKLVVEQKLMKEIEQFIAKGYQMAS